MKILYISNFSTIACRTGAEWRSHWLKSALETVGEVDTVEIVDRKLTRHIPLSLAWTALLRKICPQTAFPYYCRELKDNFIGSKHYDAIVVRYSYVAGAFGIWKLGIPCYCDIDDLPVQLSKSRMQRIICGIWQGWLYRKMSGCWIANREQVKTVAKYTRCLALPNIANPPAVKDLKGEKSQILLTVGSLAHSPNVEGIDLFIRRDWPVIIASCPNAKYWIVGGGCPEYKMLEWSGIKGVRVLGFVDDLARLYASCNAVVCPVYSGSGTCIKTVEAVMHGRVCIGPEFAFRGWTQEQKNQPFIKISKSRLAEICLETLLGNEDEARRRSEISSWARANFGENRFFDAVKEMLLGSGADRVAK